MVFHRGQVKKTNKQKKTNNNNKKQTNKQKEMKVKFSESIMLIAVSMTPRHHFQIGVVLKETVSR